MAWSIGRIDRVLNCSPRSRTGPGRGRRRPRESPPGLRAGTGRTSPAWLNLVGAPPLHLWPALRADPGRARAGQVQPGAVQDAIPERTAGPGRGVWNEGGGQGARRAPGRRARAGRPADQGGLVDADVPKSMKRNVRSIPGLRFAELRRFPTRWPPRRLHRASLPEISRPSQLSTARGRQP